MERANSKVDDWLDWCITHHERINAQCNEGNVYNLTLHPSCVRATFPGLSPFRIIRANEIIPLLIKLPSITVTSITSLLIGVTATLATFQLAHKNVATDYLHHVLRSFRLHVKQSLFILLVSLLLYLLFIRRRLAKLRLISGYVNYSSSTRGPCYVTNNVLMITNSHAGTHADSPHHFIEESHNTNNYNNNSEQNCNNAEKCKVNCHILSHFHDAHYNGSAVVLDFSTVLERYDEPAINSTVMNEALDALPQSIQRGEEPLWRLLCITRRLRARNIITKKVEKQYCSDDDKNKNTEMIDYTNDKWESSFTYFTVNAVERLLERFPRLMLLATDAPSVDASDASPINEYAHGSLFTHGVAIMENVNGAPLYSLLANLKEKIENANKVNHASSADTGTVTAIPFVRGVMCTVFNPMQTFKDSRGCSVLFFPLQN